MMMRNDMSVYANRGGDFVFFSAVIGGTMFISGVIGLVFALLSPNGVHFGAVSFCLSVAIVPILHLVGFLSHRNYGINSSMGVSVMDAIYSLPRSDRKKYQITQGEVNALAYTECEDIIAAVAKYRRSRRSGGIYQMMNDISEYNKVYREIEGLTRD